MSDSGPNTESGSGRLENLPGRTKDTVESKHSEQLEKLAVYKPKKEGMTPGERADAIKEARKLLRAAQALRNHVGLDQAHDLEKQEQESIADKAGKKALERNEEKADLPGHEQPKRPDSVKKDATENEAHIVPRGSYRQQRGYDVTNYADRTGKKNPSEKDSVKEEENLSSDTSGRLRDRISPVEKYERQRIFMPDHGVAFPFNDKHVAPGEIDRFLLRLPEGIRASLGDSRTIVILNVSASRPGNERYNLKLTQERGKNLKQELEDRGVQAQIIINALGESLAREPGRPRMSLKPPSDKDKSDQKDDARYRVALIEIHPYYQDFEGDQITAEPSMIADRRSLLPEDFKAGEKILDKAIRPIGEQVREYLPLPKNPFGNDPSEAPGISELPKSPKDLEKSTAGMGWEILVRNPQAKEIAKLRNPYYDAIAAGFVSGLAAGPENYNLANDEFQKQLYRSARGKALGLSRLEKHQVQVFLAEREIANYNLGPLPLDEKGRVTWEANDHAQHWNEIVRNATPSAFLNSTREFFSLDVRFHSH